MVSLRARATRGEGTAVQPSAINLRLIVLFYALTSILFVAPGLMPGKVYGPTDLLTVGAPYREQLSGHPQLANPRQSDQVEQLPFMFKFWTELRQGEVRLWEPAVAGGVPMLPAVYNRTLAPWNILYLVLPVAKATAAATAAAFFVAQIGAYALARRLGVSQHGALLAGVAYGFSGPLTSLVLRIHEVYLLPGLLAAVHLAIVGPRRRAGYMLVAGLFALVLLSGFPAAGLLVGYVAVAWAIYLAFSGDGAERGYGRIRAGIGRLWPVGWAFVAAVSVVSGVLLSSYRFLSTTEALERSYGLDHAAGLESLATLLSGRIYGGYQFGTWWPGSAVVHPVEGSLTAGLLVLALLVVVALRRVSASIAPRLRTPLGQFFLPLSVLVLLASYLGGPALAIVHALPFMSQNSFTRARVVCALAFALVAGVGFDALSRGRTPGHAGRAAGWLRASIAIVLALAALSLYRAATLALVSGSLATMVAGLVVPLACLCAGVVLWANRARAPVQRYGSLTIAALIALELQWGAWGFTPASPVETFYPRPTLPSRVLADVTPGGEFRLLALPFRSYRPNSAIVHGVRDVRVAKPAYGPFRDLLRIADPQVFEQSRLKSHFTQALDVRSPVLDRLAVRYMAVELGGPPLEATSSDVALQTLDDLRFSLVTDEPMRIRAVDLPLRSSGCRSGDRVALSVDGETASARHSRDMGGRVTRFPTADVTIDAQSVLQLTPPAGCVLELAAAEGVVHTIAGDVAAQAVWIGEWVVYERPSALPRVQLTADAVVEPDPQRRLDLLATVPSSGPVIVEQPIGELVRGDGDVTVLLDGDDEVRLDVRSSTRQLLVLRDTAAPGWTVAVDGAPAPLVNVDHALRGVVIAPGRSEVVFRYRPAELVLGSAVGGLFGAVVLAALVARPRWPRRTDKPARGDDAVAADGTG